MTELSLAPLAQAESGLRLAVLITLPDNLLYEGWNRDNPADKPEQLAAYLGDLVQNNHNILHLVSAPQDELWTIIESPAALLLVRQFRIDYALGCVFDHPATQGSARLAMRRLIKHIEPTLPQPTIDVGL